MRKPIIAGNWKMFKTRDEALGFMMAVNAKVPAQDVVETVICAPFTLLRCLVKRQGQNLRIGAQNMHFAEQGAFTGEIAPNMLTTLGVEYVIIGHSECRQYHGDTNDTVRQKAEHAIANGLTPIICVGETMDEKQAGKTMEIIESGVRESVPANIDTDIIIAYEPRWAIGAGLTPTDEEIATAHTLIARTLSEMGLGGTAILYGASVKGSNAAEIMSIANVDGVLVGGASLKSDDFIPIITSVK